MPGSLRHLNRDRGALGLYDLLTESGLLITQEGTLTSAKWASFQPALTI